MQCSLMAKTAKKNKRHHTFESIINYRDHRTNVKGMKGLIANKYCLNINTGIHQYVRLSHHRMPQHVKKITHHRMLLYVKQISHNRLPQYVKEIS